MNEITEYGNEINISEINNVYNDISNYYSSSIKLNPQYEKDIKEIYERSFSNFGKTALSIYHVKYMNMFNKLAKYYSEDNDELIELSNSLISIFNSYFKELNSSLNITTRDDLDELKFILKISSILMEEVIRDKNIELAYEVFFQIERRIRSEKLYKESMKILYSDNVEIKIFFDENTLSYENVETKYFEYNNELTGQEYEIQIN